MERIGGNRQSGTNFRAVSASGAAQSAADKIRGIVTGGTVGGAAGLILLQVLEGTEFTQITIQICCKAAGIGGSFTA